VAGKHVISEKPIASSVADALLLVDAYTSLADAGADAPQN
jgi:predicted dehydrogenase